ncbi:hypothetical protein PPL_03342 [Heterostelium album PN500]|uniref:Uncharacterized protein n=1 Tax=Heterostelium pallidum (strain ATCC 26659 / Pp 5 / PN500) TaxID=670386 RepID=D3B4L7_HETP5|nr:hypothetical protein PPL_03342 [Heterostelium album PN500]EFA84265.1 hypothetical protein PPL_03342 [Heterostelium album PN500]|eukprot:XP_020436381.1 hypothetical protein PPL_03342 [Heterostelium album PN500]
MGQSASVSRVLDNAKGNAINSFGATTINNHLITLNEQQEGFLTTRFDQDILVNMNRLGLKDQKLIIQNKEVQTEFSSEFNLDNIKNIVSQVLKSTDREVNLIQDLRNKPLASDDNINSLTVLVGSLDQRSKAFSSSIPSSSYSFIYNRVAPGVFVFICSSSVTLEDKKKFFGNEIVITTVFLYKMMFSIQDEANSVKVEEEDNIRKTINVLKSDQLILSQYLKDGKISPEEWKEKDDKFLAMIKKLQDNLDKMELIQKNNNKQCSKL